MRTLFDLRKNISSTDYSGMDQLYKKKVTVFDFQD